MAGSIFDRIKKFFRPPPSEASQMEPQTALAGLFLEACYRDGGLTGRERQLIDQALSDHLGINDDAAMALRVRAEEVQWHTLTPIGFATAASKGLDDAQREAVLKTMIGLIENDNRYDAMENRLVMSVANCFGIDVARAKALRAEVKAENGEA